MPADGLLAAALRPGRDRLASDRQHTTEGLNPATTGEGGRMIQAAAGPRSAAGPCRAWSVAVGRM